jgi:hypothetical protein
LGWASIAVYTHLFVKPDFCSFGNPLIYQRLLRRYIQTTSSTSNRHD